MRMAHGFPKNSLRFLGGPVIKAKLDIKPRIILRIENPTPHLVLVDHKEPHILSLKDTMSYIQFPFVDELVNV